MQKKTKSLKPLSYDTKSEELIRKKIIQLLREEIYLPLMKSLGARQKLVTNSIDGLISAIKSGQITYTRGYFEGSFSSVISKEIKKLGGTWDRKHGRWKIPRSLLTIDVKTAIGLSESTFKESLARVDKKLEELDPKTIAEKLRLEKIFDSTIFKVNKDVESTITIDTKLTDYQVERISKEYTNNMQLYVQEFAEKEIVKLRKDIQTNVQESGRYESIVKDIQSSYGVSQNKAKFLARQETKLLTTKIQQTRYQEAGVNKYRWQCVAGSAAHPVRPMHKALDGKIFDWTDPPVVDENGSRKNPGQDYGCRCKAIPIVEL